MQSASLTERLQDAAYRTPRYFWGRMAEELARELNGERFGWVGKPYLHPKNLVLRLESTEKHEEFPTLSRFYYQLDTSVSTANRRHVPHVTPLITVAPAGERQNGERNHVSLSLLTHVPLPEQAGNALREGLRGIEGLNSMAFHGYRSSMTTKFGFPNDEAFRLYFEDAVYRAEETGEDFDPQSMQNAMLFVDYDGFKQINDRIGHQEGDRLIRVGFRILADVARHHAPDGWFAAHFGGDEFMLQLHRAPLDIAHAIGGEAAARFAQQETVVSAGVKPTMTYGCVPFRLGESYYDAFHRADHAMLDAKRLRPSRAHETP